MCNSFVKYNSLKGNHKTVLERLLNMHYTEFNITSFGKKGVVTLGKERETPLEHIDGRVNNGRTPSQREILFYNNVLEKMKHLLNLKRSPYHWTNFHLSEELGIETDKDIDDETIGKIINELDNIFGDSVGSYDTESIKFELLFTLREHVKSLLASVLKYLEKESLIASSTAHVVTNGFGFYKTLKPEEVVLFHALEENILEYLNHEKWFLLNYRYANTVPKNTKTGYSLAHDYLTYQSVLTSGLGGHILFPVTRPNITKKGKKVKAQQELDISIVNKEFFMDRTLLYRMPKRRDSHIFVKRYFHIILYLWLKESSPESVEKYEKEYKEWTEEAMRDYQYNYLAQEMFDSAEVYSYNYNSYFAIETYYREAWNESRKWMQQYSEQDKILTEAIENALGILDN